MEIQRQPGPVGAPLTTTLPRDQIGLLGATNVPLIGSVVPTCTVYPSSFLTLPAAPFAYAPIVDGKA